VSPRRRARRPSSIDSGGERCGREPTASRPAWLVWITSGKRWRASALLLFIGVAFLVKYATDHVRVPIEVRLAGVALGGIALLALGWWLRLRRQGYAMILQGAGVGVLYLTVFGALLPVRLLPPTAAFALLVCIAALSAWLAIRQDAIALAAVGVVGGFLAPILTSSNTGSHVLLFSYYAVLNAGIFAIAWFKPWRRLNLLGFLFTFVIGTIWGVTRYRPEDFATTEPFLILFFLFYVAIAVFYALRQSFVLRDYLDSTLVFGTPLVVAGLQSGLVRNMPYGMALSAIGMSVVYLALAKVLYARRSDNVRLLVEAFLALGVISRRGHTARPRYPLDVRNLGARRRSDAVDRRAPTSTRGPYLRIAVAIRRGHRVRVRTRHLAQRYARETLADPEQRLSRGGARRFGGGFQPLVDAAAPHRLEAR
jgi:hypothetical protein